ncbi:segregation/condensation protein A [Candidatus Uhrbacteria bacterium]|nr:segregation/condensation protein A [Candidatus Uhrbacteria bacterium]
MGVTFKIEHFEGPLDLLLQLVEQEKLDISHVSLAAVADQFVSYMRSSPEIPLEEMADFLVVAAKLVYLKSKLLMPDLSEAELDEGPDLETQLRMYREFVKVSRKVDSLWRSKLRSYARVKRAFRQQEVKFSPPPEVTQDLMRETMGRIISRLTPLLKLPKAALERVVSVQEKIKQLFSHVREKTRMTFSSFVGRGATRTEAVACFLALLELVKQRFVRVSQTDPFDDIDIENHPEPPANDPFAESFI